ncbi:unnamed protein product [Protopolystoma xenopodis]|uniref:Uncharacterized protein n=1 Tax=Protopolystoma xenopodis TaxID=117903 RepID=A0A448X900_9PLAT|nr:unnamed protein product [Protopolystoma xenopodis]
MKFPLRAVKALKSGVENSGLVSGRSCTEIHPQTQQRNSSTDEESKVVQSYFKTQGWNLIRPISAAYSPPCDSPQPNTASSLSSSALDLLYQPLSTNLNLASRDSLALNIIVAISPLLFIPIERRSAKNGISDTLGRFSLNRAILREILPAESQTGEDSDSETEENENGDEEEEEEEQEESEEIEDELDTRDEIVEQNEGGNE